MRTAIALALLLTACGGEDGGVALDVPSCQQAMAHYYEAGCGFTDASGEISQAEQVGTCHELLVATDGIAECEAAVDYWLICLEGVPDPSTTVSHCDCSVEQEDVITCG